MKLAAILAALTLLMSPLCSCSREHPAAVPDAGASSLTQEEADALLTFYDTLPDQLSPRQQELVEALRALRVYLNEQYPGAQWQVTLLEPAGPLSGGNSNCETFHLLVDGTKEKVQLQKDEAGGWQILYDSMAGRNPGQ